MEEINYGHLKETVEKISEPKEIHKVAGAMAVIGIVLLSLSLVMVSWKFAVASLMSMGMMTLIALIYLAYRPEEEGAQRTFLLAQCLFIFPFALWIPFLLIFGFTSLLLPLIIAVAGSVLLGVEGVAEHMEEKVYTAE